MGKEAALIYGMGYITNASSLPSLVGSVCAVDHALVSATGSCPSKRGSAGEDMLTMIPKGCLVVSDSLNHASIVVGCRSSGASIKVFKHNNPEHLDHVLRKAVVHSCKPKDRVSQHH